MTTRRQPAARAIQTAIAENPVILFMKGTPEAPVCGFSARTVAVLQSLDQPFAAVDILPDRRIRQELSTLSVRPTIPDCSLTGELVGGCDIVMEMYQSGELRNRLGSRTTPQPSRHPSRRRAKRRRSVSRIVCRGLASLGVLRMMSRPAHWRGTDAEPAAAATPSTPSGQGMRVPG